MVDPVVTATPGDGVMLEEVGVEAKPRLATGAIIEFGDGVKSVTGLAMVVIA